MTQSLHIYHINEFAVQTAVDLVCDIACRSSRTVPASDTLQIQRGSLADVPSVLRKVRRQLIYDVGDGFLLEPKIGLALHIDLKAKVLTIDASDEDLPVACAWAKHAGFGAATIARNGLPIHAAGLVMDDKFIGIIAPSGTGKSTTTWFLLQQGARFANDDLIPVRVEAEVPIAFPSVSLYPKLLRVACDQYHLDTSHLLRAHYGGTAEEYYVPLPAEQRAVEPKPLSALFVFKASQEGDERQTTDITVKSRQLDASEAATALSQNLHTMWLLGKWMKPRRIEALCQAVAASVPVYELKYTRSFAVLPLLHDTITKLIKTT